MTQNKKILVIDDDLTILEIVKNVLIKCNFDTATAENGEEGLEVIKTENPDAILLDNKMPGLSGYDVLKQLKKNSATKNIPVIMLTGENSITEVAKSLDLGASDYIVKPFDNENLVVRIKNVIQQ